MNYLAHLFLAKNTDYSRLGNFLGDFVKGRREKLLDTYHPEIVDGITSHRQVDTYTDRHNAVKDAVAILKPSQGLFSGIVVDVLFDYFLSNHWETFSDIDRRRFIDDCYRSLSVPLPDLPASFNRFLPILKDYDILDSYRSFDGIDHAFYRIDLRCRRETNLSEAVSDIKRHYNDLETQFLSFFSDICGFCNKA